MYTEKLTVSRFHCRTLYDMTFEQSWPWVHVQNLSAYPLRFWSLEGEYILKPAELVTIVFTNDIRDLLRWPDTQNLIGTDRTHLRLEWEHGNVPICVVICERRADAEDMLRRMVTL